LGVTGQLISVVNGAPTLVAAPAPALSVLQARTLAAASAAAGSILAQVFPDAVHQAAFQNAGAIVAGNNGAAPASTAATYSAFSAFATVYGMTAAAFASLVQAGQNASMSMAVASATLTSAVNVATSAAAIATALAAFEAALVSVVATLNAASPPVAFVAPAAISITGVNA
jgi:hypothetical protein